MKIITIKRIVLSALFLSVGLILPLLTGQLKEIGDSLLPMHLPVMLCGIACGANYGAAVGLLMPFMRSLIFSMPPIYPNAVWMALELATYGLVIGFVYARFKEKTTKSIYISLLSAMLAGRIVWGASKAILLGVDGKLFSLAMFISGGFVDALPGIILQLILVPFCVIIIHKKGLLK